MVFTLLQHLSLHPLLIVPCPTPGPQLAKQTFSRREQLLKFVVRLRTVVPTIKDRNLKAHLGTIPPFWRIHDPMHRRFGMFARLQEIQRLKEDSTEAPQLPDQLVHLRILSRGQMSGVLKR